MKIFSNIIGKNYFSGKCEKLKINKYCYAVYGLRTSMKNHRKIINALEKHKIRNGEKYPFYFIFLKNAKKNLCTFHSKLINFMLFQASHNMLVGTYLLITQMKSKYNLFVHTNKYLLQRIQPVQMIHLNCFRLNL